MPEVEDLKEAQTPSEVDVLPKYRVDPFWPKELPNKWIMSQVGGVAVDMDNHIWIAQRPHQNAPDEVAAAQDPPRAHCCIPAPPVMEFDMEGNLLRHWGGDAPGYQWPTKEDGIFVDRQGFVWVAGNGADDRQVLKFTRDGEFIMQIGHKSDEPPQNLRTDILGQPAAFDVDEERRELYIADGYMNRRVIVFDCDTGAFKRLWGAYGKPPEDVDPGPYNPKDAVCKQFRNPVHCVKIAHDGLVYVGDRANDRIQVFTKEGEYIKEFFIFPETIGPYINPNRQQCGSVWDIVLSLDAEQKYLLVADGSNNVIWTVRRSDGKVLGKNGHAGRNAGQFHWLHHMAADSFGNLYTGEVDTGKRAQRFILLNPESQGLTNPPSEPTPPPT